MNKKSIIINQKAHKELTKISNEHNCSYGSLVESMIYYFKRTGINPNNAINENPSTMVKALDKRIVSFLKVQERDILKPLRSEVYEYYSKQNRRLKIMNQTYEKLILQLDKMDSKRTNAVLNEMKKQHEAIQEILTFLDQHNKSGIHDRIKKIFE
ncbi:BfmA/BtgA family mobilization protein [Joostella sp.]|uniref:BfmA/BtgA family mobilization protein n=1 Tax=Joostella sp. TaxID=2231138 RepID=UPI003A93E855